MGAVVTLVAGVRGRGFGFHVPLSGLIARACLWNRVPRPSFASETGDDSLACRPHRASICNLKTQVWPPCACTRVYLSSLQNSSQELTSRPGCATQETCFLILRVSIFSSYGLFASDSRDELPRDYCHWVGGTRM